MIHRGPLPISISLGSTCSRGADGDIYFFDSGSTDHVYQYTPTTNSWVTKASLFSGLRYAPAAVLGADQEIYVVGGFNNNGAVSELDIYSPATDTWATGVAPPTLGGGATAVIGSGGRMYVASGPSPMAVYTFATQSWTSSTGPPGSFGDLAAGAGSQGRPYFFGGYSSKTSQPQKATFKFGT